MPKYIVKVLADQRLTQEYLVEAEDAEEIYESDDLIYEGELIYEVDEGLSDWEIYDVREAGPDYE